MPKINYALADDAVTITVYVGERFNHPDTEIVKSETFSLAEVPDILTHNTTAKSLKGYGLMKLLQDRTSSSKTPEAKIDLMRDYFTQYFTQGLWQKPATPRTATSKRKITASLAEAIARLQDCTAIKAESALKALSKEDFAGILANERVIAMIAEVEAENADTTALDLTDLG